MREQTPETKPESPRGLPPARQTRTAPWATSRPPCIQEAGQIPRLDPVQSVIVQGPLTNGRGVAFNRSIQGATLGGVCSCPYCVNIPGCHIMRDGTHRVGKAQQHAGEPSGGRIFGILEMDDLPEV